MSKNIFFIKTDSAYLPEINAYCDVFSSKQFRCHVIKYEDIRLYDNDKSENIFWFFMGFYPYKVRRGIVVHDYRSLSTGTLRILKDSIKRYFQPTPTVRVFLNKKLEQALNFQDNAPSFFIDMGVDFLIPNIDHKKILKKYDYIYVGVISHERGIDVLLKNYVKNVTPEKTLLLVGNYEQSLYDIYSSPNIIFTGKVCKSQVYDLLMQSKTGISYIPKGMPYDIQTSTKLLEYAWCGLDIIANDSKSNILTANRIGYTCKPLSNSFLDLEINKTKNVNVYAKISWKKIICDSGILTFLEKY